MNAQLKESATSLLPIESINAVEVFTGAKLDDLLQQIRAETTSIVPDVSTAMGRKEIASLAYKVARSKTAIDDAGKELVSEWKQRAAVVDASRKKARDYLDDLKSEVRAPLDAWEAEETRREQELIEQARQRREAEEAARVAELERREAEVREAEARIAAAAKAEADKIAAEKAEAERAEREAAIRAEAEERAARDAQEAIARAEREAQEARDAAARAAEQAERDKAEAVRQAEARAVAEAAAVEQARSAAEARQRADEERRAANRRHCASVNNKAKTALLGLGLTDTTAQTVVAAIASGAVPGVSIAY